MVTAKTESQFAKRIGRALAKQRIAKNFTQEEVAERVGVEQETISRFERGATVPPLIRLMDLAELYGVPLDAFIRSGSSRPIDQSNDIVFALTRLKEEDRDWVRVWVVEMCNRLSERS